MHKDPIFRFFSIWDDAALQNTIAQCLKFTKNISVYNTNYIVFSKQKYLKNSQYEQNFFVTETILVIFKPFRMKKSSALIYFSKDERMWIY